MWRRSARAPWARAAAACQVSVRGLSRRVSLPSLPACPPSWIPAQHVLCHAPSLCTSTHTHTQHTDSHTHARTNTHTYHPPEGADDEGGDPAGASSRGRKKASEKGEAPEDFEEDEELREGKLRFRGGREEAATYDGNDEVGLGNGGLKQG